MKYQKVCQKELCYGLALPSSQWSLYVSEEGRRGSKYWEQGQGYFTLVRGWPKCFISIFEGVVNGIGLRLVLGSARCFIDYFCFWRTGKLLKNLGSFLGSR